MSTITPDVDAEFAINAARLALARIANGDPDPRRLATVALGDMRTAALVGITSVDPRDPDHSKQGIFVHHNCHRCADGTRPDRCPTPERPGNCGYPYARND